MVAEAQRGKKHIRKHQREKRATEHNTHIHTNTENTKSQLK